MTHMTHLIKALNKEPRTTAMDIHIEYHLDYFGICKKEIPGLFWEILIYIESLGYNQHQE